MKRKVLAGAFMVAVALGAMLALSQTETSEAQGPPAFSLPPQAALIAPGVWSLGTAIHNGQVVEGIAIADHNGHTHAAKPDKPGKPGKPGGGGDTTPADPVTCFSYLFGGSATWKTAEVYRFNPAGGPGVGVGDLDDALNVWETASGANIFGDGQLTADILEADTNRRKGPDGSNEVYFAAIKGRGSSSTIAFTILWANTNTGAILEWDMVFNTNFTWSAEIAGVPGAMDFLNIAAHEAGHAAAMGHTDTDSGCIEQTMYPTASTEEIDKRSLDVGDIAGIAALY